MGRIRTYHPHDVPQIVDLHRRTLLDGDAPGPLFADYLETFYGKTLFDHPWVDEEIPSLVYELDDGRILGLVGVVPRPMSIEGCPVRAAVSVRFMVDPESPHAALAAAALHRRFLRGPQDLSLVENANTAARRIWEGTRGAAVLPLGSISWTAHRDEADADPDRLGDGYDLDATELLECVSTAADDCALRPVYDRASMQWLLDFLAAARYRGTLHGRAVIGDSGAVLGWYLYYSNPAGYNGVLQIRSFGDTGAVFRSLLAHTALAGGAPVTSGRLQPGLLSTVAEHGCVLGAGPWTVVHSDDRALLRTLTSGDSFLTRLEGEFC